jgi:hypothetical protein
VPAPARSVFRIGEPSRSSSGNWSWNPSKATPVSSPGQQVTRRSADPDQRGSVPSGRPGFKELGRGSVRGSGTISRKTGAKPSPVACSRSATSLSPNCFIPSSVRCGGKSSRIEQTGWGWTGFHWLLERGCPLSVPLSDSLVPCQDKVMRIEEWWPKVDPSTQQWLINNNGDVVPPNILDQITAVAGAPTADASWVGDSVPEGVLLSDEAIDWIEETANDEVSGDE